MYPTEGEPDTSPGESNRCKLAESSLLKQVGVCVMFTKTDSERGGPAERWMSAGISYLLNVIILDISIHSTLTWDLVGRNKNYMVYLEVTSVYSPLKWNIIR